MAAAEGEAADVRPFSLEGIRTVLCLGAHCDDIEIGCGGTILKLLAQRSISVHWLVFTSDAQRSGEGRAGAKAFLAGASGSTIEIERQRERYLPYIGTTVKERFDRLGTQVAPDLVFTHYGGDLHQDHRILSELTYNTFRDALILEYEVPKYDGDLGRPNVFVHLDESRVEQKVAGLLGAFPSQADKPWFTAETFRAILRIRGVESRAPAGYAEAFYCRKLVLA